MSLENKSISELKFQINYLEGCIDRARNMADEDIPELDFEEAITGMQKECVDLERELRKRVEK